MGSRGVLMMTWGARAYGYAAHNLAMSIRHVSPSLPVTIICDDETRKGLRDLTLFDQIIPMQSTPSDPALMKMQVYDKLPYEETLFMDVDGLVLNPLEPLFDELAKGGDYRCHVHAWYDQTAPDKLPMMVWADRSVIWSHYNFDNTHRLPATQSSLQYIRKGEFCRDLFGRIQANYSNRIPLERLRSKWGGGQPDELYLNITLAQLGYDPSIPDNIVYWGDSFSRTWGEVKAGYYLLSMFGTAQNIKKPYVMGYDGTLAPLGRAYKWDMIAGAKIANKATNTKMKNNGLGRGAFAKRFFKEQPKPTTPVNGSVYLFTSYYKVDNSDRQKELDTCMMANINNSIISKIYNLGTEFDHPKVVNLTYDRPTYQDFIEEANIAGGEYTIIANSDIYFDSSINWLDKVDMTDCMIALCRYDVKGGGAKLFAYSHSQDSWMFKGRIRITGADYPLGVPGCDNRFAYDAMMAGYRLSNCAKDIKTYHLHESNHRTYTQADRLVGGYQPIEITSVLDIGQVKRLLLHQPGKVGDIIICLPIAKWYSDRGYKVEWLVQKEYHTLFNFVPYVTPVERAEGYYDKTVDLSFGLNHKSPSHRLWLSRQKQLDSFVTLKYEIAEVPLSEIGSLNYERNYQREEELYHLVIGDASGGYALVHNDSDYGTAADVRTDLRVVQFRKVGDYTIFDWRKVIEKAAEIHAIDSSLVNFADRCDITGDLHYYVTDKVPNQWDRTILTKKWNTYEQVAQV